MEEQSKVGQATDDYMAHALCTLDNLGYRRRVCIDYYFSSAQIVIRTHSNVTLQSSACLIPK